MHFWFHFTHEFDVMGEEGTEDGGRERSSVPWPHPSQPTNQKTSTPIFPFFTWVEVPLH